MSEASETIRRTFAENDNRRDEGLTTPDSIVRYDDIVYGADHVQQSLDVYRPKDAEGKLLPVIVSVHGGGWVYGDKDRYQFYCMSLAQRGFAVVNFTYRLAPENKFPSSLEDTNLVFSWVLEHAMRYGFDTTRIFAVGDSAGAHTLCLYVCICTNPVCASGYDFKVPAGFAPKAIALNCGVYQIEAQGEKPDLTQLLIADLLPDNGTQRELQKINVIKYITQNFPPTFLMTCTGDFQKNQASLLAAKLAECDVSFIYRYYGDAKHVLGHVFHCDVRSADAILCNDEESAFFKEYCK